MEAFSVTEAMVAWIASMGHRVSSRVRDDSALPFVTVERTGGGVHSLVDRPVMAVQCWATTEDEAESMANTLRLALLRTEPPAGIHSVRVNAGPYPLFDERTRTPRYQLALDVACQLAT